MEVVSRREIPSVNTRYDVGYTFSISISSPQIPANGQFPSVSVGRFVLHNRGIVNLLLTMIILFGCMELVSNKYLSLEVWCLRG